MSVTVLKEKQTRTRDRVTVPYFVKDDNDNRLLITDAIDLALAQAEMDQGTDANDYLAQEVSLHSHRVTVLYDLSTRTASTPDFPTWENQGTVRYRFNFQAQTRRIYEALEVTATLPNVEGRKAIRAIRVNGKKIAHGIELIPPPQTFELEFTIRRGYITNAYQLGIADIVGTVNDDAFFGFPRGTLFLASCTGGLSTKEAWQIQFGFAYRGSRTVSIEDLGDLHLLGHEEHWVEQTRIWNDADKKWEERNKQAYAIRVYEYADWSTSGLSAARRDDT